MSEERVLKYVFTENEYKIMEDLIRAGHSLAEKNEADPMQKAMVNVYTKTNHYSGSNTTNNTWDKLAEELDKIPLSRRREIILYATQCYDEAEFDLFCEDDSKTLLDNIAAYFTLREEDENPEIDPEISAEVDRLVAEAEAENRAEEAGDTIEEVKDDEEELVDSMDND